MDLVWLLALILGTTIVLELITLWIAAEESFKLVFQVRYGRVPIVVIAKENSENEKG